MDALLSALEKINESFGGLEKVSEQASLATKEIGETAEKAGRSATKGASGFAKFGESILRIAKYRAIRSLIRNIMSAFSEGLQNVREYSEGLTGEGHRIATVFNNLSAHSLKMKNQLGSAFAELLAQIMPVIETVISLLTRAMNVIAQFFAFFGGNDKYYKAVDATQEVAHNLSGGASAAKEIRRQLMGFDEINRLDAPTPSGGGGGGAAASAANNMFEYTDLEKWTEKLGVVRDILSQLWEDLKAGFTSAWDYIKEHFDFPKLFNDFVTTLTGVVQVIRGILTGDIAMVFKGLANIITGLGGIVDNVVGFIASVVDSLLGWLKDTIMGGLDWISEKTGISLYGVKNLISGTIDTIRIAIAGFVDAIRQVLNGIVDFIAGVFTIDWARAWSGVVDIFVGILKALYTAGVTILNSLITFINYCIGMLLSVVNFVTGKDYNYKMNLLSVPKFANGGIVEDGLFMANHGEIMGKFSNGKTAVANNEQIISGIEAGVFRAMTSALAGQENGNGVKSVEINIDGRAFYRATWDDYKAVSRERGVSLVTG